MSDLVGSPEGRFSADTAHINNTLADVPEDVTLSSCVLFLQLIRILEKLTSQTCILPIETCDNNELVDIQKPSRDEPS